jgi:tRNA(fMet)-specific endonuclease VapC
VEKTLLDTDIFSEVLKGRDKNLARRAALYHLQFGQYTISAITVMEVIKGFQKARQPERIRRLVSNLAADEVLDFDGSAAEVAGQIYGELERTGLPIGRADPMIASIAIRHNLVLTTGNTRHFERLGDLGFPLRLQDWRK